MKLFIANRGEIARRIIRTAQNLNWITVAGYADPDANAPFVQEASEAIRIGPSALSESYLSAEAILNAARATEATAIHPGYGFLSENADFAQRVKDEGLIWVGPSPALIAMMGSKIEARKIAETAGVPIIPGFSGSQQSDDLQKAADSIGYPVLIKASAGGGGKGIRVAHSQENFFKALDEARNEASRSFNDSDVIVERYIEQPRHIEVQIVGDVFGNIIDLGTRDCSVQRRYQKIIEEAPASNLNPDTELGLRETATQLARNIGYDNIGTVEFIVDAATGEYFFLEMNTRLQVEHPITEMVTGLDLVELQMLSATGKELAIRQDDITFTGHAIEFRLNAEDPSDNFSPRTGVINHLSVPKFVRWDSGIEVGSEISPFYDSMIAKLIISSPTRSEALAGAKTALENLLIGPVANNASLLYWVLDQDEFREGSITSRFLDEIEVPIEIVDSVSIGAAANELLRSIQSNELGPWASVKSFRVTNHKSAFDVLLSDSEGKLHEVQTNFSAPMSRLSVDFKTKSAAVNQRGATHVFQLADRTEAWMLDASLGLGNIGDLTAPFPAVIIETPVQAGDDVEPGDIVLVIEAMKMLHSLTATGRGTVSALRVQTGDAVQSKQILMTFTNTKSNSESQPNDA
ncbi:MAG: biotin carboxylase N-terminal domain-containing protein [Actinomycetota bacterium]|nr:biotin carboxylase N-terminal domain-containing protein [Actinomycetota bacterium]